MGVPQTGHLGRGGLGERAKATGEGKHFVKRPEGRDHHAGHHRQTRKRRSALAITFLLVLLAGLMASAGTGQAALIHEFDSYFGGGSLVDSRSPRGRSDHGRPLRPRTRRRLRLPLLRRTRRRPKHSNRTTSPPPGRTRSAAFEFRASSSAAQVAIDNSGTSTEGEILRQLPGFETAVRRRPAASTSTAIFETELTHSPTAELLHLRCHHRLRRQCLTSRNTTPGSGTTPTTTRSPTPTYERLGEEGPVCGIARASSGLKYNVFETQRPGHPAPADDRPQGRDLALTLDPSSDDVYVSEGGVVSAISDDGIQFDQFGSGDVTEARGVAIDEVSGTAYVSDTPNGRIAVFGGARAYRVEAETTGTGLGAVSADTPPLEDCGDNGQCAGYYVPSTVVLKATPQPHSKVDGWTGCDDVNLGRRRMQRRSHRRQPQGLRQLHPAAADGHRRDRWHRHRVGQRRQRARRDPGLRRRRDLLGSLRRGLRDRTGRHPDRPLDLRRLVGRLHQPVGPVPPRHRRHPLCHRPLHRPACGQREEGRGGRRRRRQRPRRARLRGRLRRLLHRRPDGDPLSGSLRPLDLHRLVGRGLLGHRRLRSRGG